MTDRMQHYLECPDCNVRMWLRDSKFGRFYGCGNYPKCDMVHSCHEDGTPMGVPANKETRQARIRAHTEFDKLWKGQRMSRSQAYTWMQLTMGLTADDAHIGRFTDEQCATLVGCCQDRVSERQGLDRDRDARSAYV